jgi:hypothetical protein
MIAKAEEPFPVAYPAQVASPPISRTKNKIMNTVLRLLAAIAEYITTPAVGF